MAVVELDKRQRGGGITNSAIEVDTAALPTDGLVVDANGASITHPRATWTLTQTLEPTGTDSVASAPPVGNTAATSEAIPLGTVIGACVGAFVGAALLIFVGVLFYRRSTRRLKTRAASRGTARSPFRDDGKTPRSNSEPPNAWIPFDGAMQEKPAPANRSPFLPLPVPQHQADDEKFDMFSKTPSAVSCNTDEPAFEMKNHPYSHAKPPQMPQAADLLGRAPQHALGAIDPGSPISTSVLAATRLEGGAMSPNSVVAIPTPPAVTSRLHRWESAEVIDYDSQETASQASVGSNPFFGGGSDSYAPARSRSRGNSATRSRSDSTSTVQQSPSQLAKGKGKARVVSIDPFNDPLPVPSFISHQPSGSASSAASNERAIRQLAAATGMTLNEDEIQRRLKAVSMQPSFVSDSGETVMYDGDSMYTNADADLDLHNQDTVRKFPTPPSSIGHPNTGFAR